MAPDRIERQLPQSHRAIVTTGGEGGPIRTERHASDPIRMSVERAVDVPRVHIP